MICKGNTRTHQEQWCIRPERGSKPVPVPVLVPVQRLARSLWEHSRRLLVLGWGRGQVDSTLAVVGLRP